MKRCQTSHDNLSMNKLKKGGGRRKREEGGGDGENESEVNDYTDICLYHHHRILCFY